MAIVLSLKIKNIIKKCIYAVGPQAFYLIQSGSLWEKKRKKIGHSYSTVPHLKLRLFPAFCSGAHQLSTDLREDEIKANKNHIKEYYSLTAISLHRPVSFWWIPHLVQWMV